MSTKENKIKFWANVGLLTTAIIWGFAFVVVKNSLDVVPPTYMLAFRFTIAFLLLAILFAGKLKQLNREFLIQGLILGTLLFLSYLFQTIGCQYTTAGKNAFLTTVYVVLVPFLHWILNKKKPDMYCMAAAVLAIVGIGLLSLQGDLTMNIGDVLTLICGLGYALHMIYIDRYAKKNDPVVLTVLQLGVAALWSWILAPFLDGGFPAGAMRFDMITGMLYLGVFSTMIGFLLQNVCQKHTTPNAASLLLSTESVFGAGFSVIFLGEAMTPRMIVGAALILVAIVMAETKFSFLKVGKKQKEAVGNV